MIGKTMVLIFVAILVPRYLLNAKQIDHIRNKKIRVEYAK